MNKKPIKGLLINCLLLFSSIEIVLGKRVFINLIGSPFIHGVRRSSCLFQPFNY